MAIHNINNMLGNQSTKVASGNTSSQAASSAADNAEQAQQAKGSVRQDAVVLTDQAQQLGRVQQRLSNAPTTNQAKVEALKSAIDKGEYKVDSQRVAKKMMTMESDLEKLYR